MQTEFLIFYIIVLIYSIVLHEIAHGYAAYRFGDRTAFWAGRLTLNPIPHLDMFGSLIIPGILAFSGSSLLFGWAKPVPVNENNLNPQKLGNFVVSIAGVATNFLLALFFIVISKFFGSETAKYLCFIGALTNLALAFFNLIPVPPADGYRIIENFLPWKLKYTIDSWFNQYGLPLMILTILIASQIFSLFFPYIVALLDSVI